MTGSSPSGAPDGPAPGWRRRVAAWAARAQRHPRVGPSLSFVRAAAARAASDRISGLAAEVAFWSLLSVVPVVLVLASLLGTLQAVVGRDVAGRAESAVVEAMGEVFTDQAGGLIDAVRQLFSEPRPGLFSVALLFVLWTAGRVFAAVVNGLDVVGGSGGGRRRSWLHRRLLGVALGAGSLVVASVVLAALVVSPVGGAAGWGVAVALVVLVAWAATMYHLAPSQRTRWRHGLPGALVAGGAWVAFTLGLRVYLGVQGGNPVVTGLGGVLIVLLWLYLMALGLLGGALVNAVAADRRRCAADGDGPYDGDHVPPPATPAAPHHPG